MTQNKKFLAIAVVLVAWFLTAAAAFFIPRWEKQPDGAWQATVVVVGRDGITPPM
jgi:hypothetical protein